MINLLLLIIVALCVFQHAASFNARPSLALKKGSRVFDRRSLVMHRGHHHGDHDHDHNHYNHKGPVAALSSFGRAYTNKLNIKVFFSALMSLLAPLIFNTKGWFTRRNLFIFMTSFTSLSIFSSLKEASNDWMSKMKGIQSSLVKHSTPITREFFFKNGNAADRVTLLGVIVNIALSISKFWGGLVFNSAVLVSDAGHSLSDLFSDFITLWAVQVGKYTHSLSISFLSGCYYYDYDAHTNTIISLSSARLPADEDHPYGHGKFESVGSLFLSLTLLVTGVGVGGWSYNKMQQMLVQLGSTSVAVKDVGSVAASGLATATSTVKAVSQHAGGIGHMHVHLPSFGAAAGAAGPVGVAANIAPSWPALIFAAFSIVSKEWLFRVTKRVGLALNSQIIVANAWHHRSDAFSSVISLFSIALAILFPRIAFIDAAAGIFVAGTICMTGAEILIESISELTDTSDEGLEKEVQLALDGMTGVFGVQQLRTRTVGSGASLVDLTIFTDPKLSVSVANTIAEKTRWHISKELPRVLDISVRAKPWEETPNCPLLAEESISGADNIEAAVRSVLLAEIPEVVEIKKVTTHFYNNQLTLDLIIRVPSTLSVGEANEVATRAKQLLENETVVSSEIFLELGESNSGNSQPSSPPLVTAGGSLK